MKKYLFNAQMFSDGAGAGAGTGADGNGGTESAAVPGVANPAKGRNALANVVYGKQAQSDDNSNIPEGNEPATNQEGKLTFEELIKGEYKEDFKNEVQKVVKRRIGETKDMEQRLASSEPIFALLAQKYGVDSTDIEAISKAIQEDDSYFEQEALEKGLSVEQLKMFKRMESENRSLTEALETQKRQQASNEIYGKWMQEAESLKQKYGLNDFSLETEVQNPDFIAILKANGSVEAAYMATHFDQMLTGAMAATADNVSKAIAKNVTSRAKRPTEGAVSSQPGVEVKSDVSKLTKADREEIARRAARGEVISF